MHEGREASFVHEVLNGYENFKRRKNGPGTVTGGGIPALQPIPVRSFFYSWTFLSSSEICPLRAADRPISI